MFSDNEYYSLFIGILYILLISGLIFISIKKGEIQKIYFCIKLSTKNLVIGFASGLAYLSANIAYINFFDKLGIDPTIDNYASLIFEKILGATFEEIIFRLLFIAIIFKHSKNIYLAILTSSFLFSILHVLGDHENTLLMFFHLFTAGLLLSFLYLRYSIFTAIFFHSIFNIGMEIFNPINEMGIDIEIIEQSIANTQLYFGTGLNVIVLILVLLFDKRIPEIHLSKKIN